jgi:molybdate transport system permease protein
MTDLRKTGSHETLPPVGPGLDVLSVVSLGMLGLFVAIVVTLLVADVAYLIRRGISLGDFWGILVSRPVLAGIRLSLATSLITLGLVVAFALPIGYALSRYRFPGRALLNTVVDVPIVLPPIVLGLSLLAFFGTSVGRAFREGLQRADLTLVSGIGIVMCQFLVSVSYCIRAMKASFDAVDRRLEDVALSLGCSRWAAFRRVTLPLARGGVLAGSIMAWARAIGVFGPLMVFVGTGPRVQVMPTAMWLELSIGNVEVALAIALVTVALAGAALAVVHWLAPGRTWT